MELEQMKTQWEALDRKLSESNRINGMIVKKMIEQRANKGVSKLITYELIGAIFLFVFFPLMIFWFKYVWNTTLMHIIMYFAISIIGIGCITQTFKVFLLFRINLTRSVSGNTSTLNHYIIFIKREKIISIIIALVFSVLLILYMLSFKHIELWRWTAVICAMVIAPVLAVWQYKKMYNANINAIRQSLDELKELKEE